MGDDCSLKLIRQALDQCLYVTDNCHSNSPFSFIKMYYCGFDQSILFIPLGLFFVYLCFYVLGSTADSYLSPLLEQISKGLRMSQSLAGVTLLALGNGAPDVFSSLSAGGSDMSSTGFYLAASSSLGSGMFVSTIIASAITLMTKKPIKVTPHFFIRDVGFYIIAILVIMYAIVIRKKLDTLFSICFLSIYVIYVAFVFIQNRIITSRQERYQKENLYFELRESAMPKIKFDDELVDFISRTEELIKEEEVIAGFYHFDDHHQKPENQDKHHSHHNNNQGGVVIRETYFNHIFKDKDNSRGSNPQIRSSDLQQDQSYMFNKMKMYIKKKYQEEVNEDDAESSGFSLRRLIHYIIAKPFNLWRELMIPISEEDVWRRNFSSLAPIVGLITVLAYTEFLDIFDHFQQAAAGVAVLLGLVIRLKTYRNKPPQKTLMFFLLFSFAMSIFWIWATAQLLIDLLEIFGLLTGLPNNLLALTVLAWGNSVGDFIANTSIAKKGFAEMALTGCFAAPLFNNVLGLGITVLKSNYITGEEITCSIEDFHARIPLIMIGGNFLTLFLILITTICNGSHLSKIQAFINILIYAGIIVVIVVQALQ